MTFQKKTQFYFNNWLSMHKSPSETYRIPPPDERAPYQYRNPFHTISHVINFEYKFHVHSIPKQISLIKFDNTHE